MPEKPLAPSFKFKKDQVVNNRRLSMENDKVDALLKSSNECDLSYPTHIRISSQKQIVSQIQNDIRRHMTFRDEFQPSFVLPEERGYFDEFYKPNKKIYKDKAEMEIKEFLQKKGKIAREPKAIDKEALYRKFGKPFVVKFGNKVKKEFE